MDHARVDRRASEPDEDKPRKRRNIGTGDQHCRDPDGDYRLSHADHLRIVKLYGYKSADRTPDGYPDEEKSGKACRRVCGDSLVHREITARPKPCGLLECAVAEEAEHDLPGAGNYGDLPQCKRFSRFFVFGGTFAVSFFPQREAENKDRGQNHLDYTDISVSCAPAPAGGQRVPHQVRSRGGTHAPHTVKPAHVPALIMKRNVVVQRCVHASRAEPVRNCPNAEKRKRACHGKTEERRRSHRNAGGGDRTRSESAGQPVALQTRNDRSERDDHGNDAGVRKRYAEFGVHCRPSGAEQGIRQTETDKGEVYDRQKQINHLRKPPARQYDRRKMFAQKLYCTRERMSTVFAKKCPAMPDADGIAPTAALKPSALLR